VRHQVLQPYNTSGKTAVLYILNFIFFDIREGDKIVLTER